MRSMRLHHTLWTLPTLAAGIIACGGPAQPTVATKLAFTTQPTNTTAGVAMTSVVQVAIQEASGNTVTSARDAVTLALGTNPGAGSLSGTLTVAATLGTATFSNLRIDQSGSGYTFVASAGGLSTATSVPFSVGVDTTINSFTGLANGANVVPAATDTTPRASVNFNAATLAYTYGVSVAPSGIIDSIALYQNAAGAALRATASVILCAGVAACSATSGTATLVAPATTASIRASLIAYGTQLVFFTTTAQKAAGGAIRGTMFPNP